MKTVFGVLGGDKRQLYLARSVLKDGFLCFVSGMEKLPEAAGLPSLPPKELAEKCDVIILPLPATLDGKTLNAPYSSEVIVLDDEFVSALENKLVYGGMVSRLIQSSEHWSRIALEDYWLREDFALLNAIPTAEGAVALAVTNYPAMLCGAKCLVTGWGRIGSILARLLRAMGAKVFVAERKSEKRAMARSIGCEALTFDEINRPFDIIFNTVPGKVIGRDVLMAQSKSCLVIELASKPGGIDREAAQNIGIKLIDGSSLPGRFSPKSAGEFIKEAVYNMLEE